jgi:dolichol-phosphate mannosyltransferase
MMRRHHSASVPEVDRGRTGQDAAVPTRLARPRLRVVDAPRTAPVVAVVLPAYRSARQIASVVAAVPPIIQHLIVVDDASPDDLQAVLAGIGDSRLVILRHPVNRGVGAAMKTGFARALALGVDVVVKVDSDGQMDPALVPAFIEPIVAGRADLTKGNRFVDRRLLARMPRPRRFGNLALSFLVKAASGYWGAFDPCNGYIAVSGRLLRALPFDRLADRYFFEISLLCEAYLAGALLCELPIAPVYGDETSSLRPWLACVEFLPKLGGRTLRRVGHRYLGRGVQPVAVCLGAGLPLAVAGTAASVAHRWNGHGGRIPRHLGPLALLLAAPLLLHALRLDVRNEPGRGPR